MRRAALAVAFTLSLCGSAFAQQAEYDKGLQYHGGDGVVQNYARAAAFFEKAAAQGHAAAQNFLGRYLYEGLGVPQDRGAALALLEQAASAGDPQHIFDLAKALEADADGVARAAVLYQTAADAGHVDAAVSLGLLYHEGRGVVQDYDRARALYERPAAQGHARALNNMGLLYVRGTGVPQDYAQAAAYFGAAADQGLAAAMTNLGVLYENGYGVPLNEAQAAELYMLGGRGADRAGPGYIYDARLVPLQVSPETGIALERAAQAGDPVAQFQLGWALVQGNDVSFEDQGRAAQLFRQAAEAGHGPAMANLGAMYARGAGLPQDYVLAQMWLLLAQARGVGSAMNMVPDLAAKLTSGQINQAQALADKIFQQ